MDLKQKDTKANMPIIQFIQFLFIALYTENIKVKRPKERREILDENSLLKKDIPKLRIKPIRIPLGKPGFVFFNSSIPIRLPIKIMILAYVI